MIAPRIGAGLDRHEAIIAGGVGQRAATAGEIGIEAREDVGRLRCTYRPPAFVCQISIRVFGTGRPLSSSTRPETLIRCPIGSPAAGE